MKTNNYIILTSKSSSKHFQKKEKKKGNSSLYKFHQNWKRNDVSFKITSGTTIHPIVESRQINRKNKEGSGIHARGEESVSQIIRRDEAALRRDKRMPIARAILAVSRCPLPASKTRGRSQ